MQILVADNHLEDYFGFREFLLETKLDCHPLSMRPRGEEEEIQTSAIHRPILNGTSN